MSKLISFIFISFCSVSKLQAQDVGRIDYYWRNYNGVIPQDALPAGKGVNGNNLYIGQIYEHKLGLFIGTIIPGKMEVEYSAYGLKKADKHIKILCTQHPENFIWLPTTSNTFTEDTTNKHVVIGGHNDEVQNNYSIGRVMYDGNIQIGPITSYYAYNFNANFFFVYKNRHFINMKSYQVLIYEPKSENGIRTY